MAWGVHDEQRVPQSAEFPKNCDYQSSNNILPRPNFDKGKESKSYVYLFNQNHLRQFFFNNLKLSTGGIDGCRARPD